MFMFSLQLMDSKKALLERDGTPHFYVKILASLEDALQTQITKVSSVRIWGKYQYVEEGHRQPMFYHQKEIFLHRSMRIVTPPCMQKGLHLDQLYGYEITQERDVQWGYPGIVGDACRGT